MSFVPVCTSKPAVTPYARFARNDQFWVSRMPRRISVQCAFVSMNPGEMVLPLTSNTFAPAATLLFAPTLLIRLFSTTMSAFLRISSPYIVTTVAPRSTTVPFGVLRGISRLTAISCTSFSCSSVSFLPFSRPSFLLSLCPQLGWRCPSCRSLWSPLLSCRPLSFRPSGARKKWRSAARETGSRPPPRQSFFRHRPMQNSLHQCPSAASPARRVTSHSPLVSHLPPPASQSDKADSSREPAPTGHRGSVGCRPPQWVLRKSRVLGLSR